jgi:hypothetical protein
MRILSFFALICFACGCARSTKHILPPLYESQYAVVVGIESSGEGETREVSTMLASIAMKSGFTAAVLEQPFDAEMVDLVLRVREVSIVPRTYGFIPRRIEFKGMLFVQLMDNKGSVIKDYRTQGTIEQSSLNPFGGSGDAKLLIVEMITSILDDLDDDMQEEAPRVVRRKVNDESRIESKVELSYPILSDLRRNEIHAHTRIQGILPPRKVTLHVLDRQGARSVSQQLYYDAVARRNGTSQWDFSATTGTHSIPFASMVHYEVEITDVDGISRIVSEGSLKTVSKGMYKIKQAEVLTHGTIFSAFGGLVLVMLLYSL